MAGLITRANLTAHQQLQRNVDHGLDLDAIRLPILPPGPYISSDGMSDDIELLEEAPVNMRKKTVYIDLIDSDSDEDMGGGTAGTRAAEKDDSNEDDKEDSDEASDEPEAVAHPLGRKRKASTPLPVPKRRPAAAEPVARASGSGRANSYTLGGAVAGEHRREPKRKRPAGSVPVVDTNGAGPSRVQRCPQPTPPARERAMMVAFGDEDAQEVPLGRGGLGVPERLSPPPASDEDDRASSVLVADTSRSSSSRRRRVVRDDVREETPPSPIRPNLHPAQAAPAPKDAADYLPAVLEVIPDICTTWAYEKLQSEIALGQPDPAASVIQVAFEMEPSYPVAMKVASASKLADQKDKNFRSEEYKRDERLGPVYDEMSNSLLNELFPSIPVHYLRESFATHSRQLIPTYFALVAASESDADPKPFQPLKSSRNAKGKGRPLLHERFSAIEGVPAEDPRRAQGRAMYEEERRWLVDYLRQQAEDDDAQKARDIEHAEKLANGGGMECGCCFGEELMEDMFQCSEGHLFCRACTTMHIETKLGEQKHTFACMDTSSCPAVFPDSEVTRLLPIQSLRLYHRLKQASELDSANIEGLETCPNCPFSAIIDNPDEKLFRCMAPECGAVTCRKCKRVEHLPKTCEEMEADRKLDKRHAVEDAMSDALIRRCPKATCGKPFYKEEGCNKITCQMCATVSCYICRQIITNGYAHFNQDPANYARPAVKGKCALWDTKGDQDAQAVVAARDAAQVLARQAAAAEGVQLADADLNVEAPVAPVRPAYHAYAGAARAPVDHAAMLEANRQLGRLADPEGARLHHQQILLRAGGHVEHLARPDLGVPGAAAVPAGGIPLLPAPAYPYPGPYPGVAAYLAANPPAGADARIQQFVQQRQEQQAAAERARAARVAAAGLVPGAMWVDPLPMADNPGPGARRHRR